MLYHIKRHYLPDMLQNEAGSGNCDKQALTHQGLIFMPGKYLKDGVCAGDKIQGVKFGKVIPKLTNRVYGIGRSWTIYFNSRTGKVGIGGRSEFHHSKA